MRPTHIRGEGVKMVNMKELFSFDRISNQVMDLVPLDSKEARFLLENGDLLFARQSLIAEGAGKCSVIVDVPEPTTFESHILRVRLAQNKNNPYFYYYYFKSRCGKHQIQSIVNQVAAAGIKSSDLGKLEVVHPEKEEQDRISSILVTFDEKIENNNRIIAALEEATQSTFQELFVKKADQFEKVPFTNEVKVLGGGTPSTRNPEYWNGNTPFFAPGDANSHFYVINTEKHISELGLENCNSKLFPKDTVFITARGTVGKTVLAGIPMAMNQSCYALQPENSLSPHFVFLWVKHLTQSLLKQAVGGVFNTITTATFENSQIVIPDDASLRMFDAFSQSNFEKILSLLEENQKLAAMQELLLPRLMSGETRV